jgi:CO/xanthine dehydrogenase FAD-binding subunit
MKPGTFEYRRVASTEEALAALAADGEDVRVLAGGQSLIPMMNMRMARPTVLVDLGHVRELDYVRADDGVLRVGTMTRQVALERSADAARLAPLAVAATKWIGHRQIRSRGTVGGTIAHADPAAELPATALALDAELVIRSAGGEKVVRATDFFLGFFATAIEPGEMLVEIRFPAWGRHAAFSEVARRHGDFAIAGVAAALELGADGRVARAGIAMAGVGAEPVKAPAAEAALVGREPTEEVIADAAQAATGDASPSSDIHGSAAFRSHLVRVLTADALRRALGITTKERPHGV